MFIIHTMIFPAFQTHARILSACHKLIHNHIDDIGDLIRLRDDNPLHIVVVSRKNAVLLQQRGVDLSNFFFLRDVVDQQTLDQSFTQLFRPVKGAALC